jgi:hypothetical protein
MITKTNTFDGPRRSYYPFNHTCEGEKMTSGQRRQLISLIYQNIEDEDSRDNWLAQVNNEDLSAEEANSLILDFESSSW